MASKFSRVSLILLSGAARVVLLGSLAATAGSDNLYRQSVGISNVFADKKGEFDEGQSKVEPHRESFGSETPRDGRKSVLKAAVLSALLPGAGEYYVGNRKKARYFFTIEALSWAGCLAFRTYGHWREDDYVRFARTNANASLEGKSDEFRDMVGFYRSIDDYNSLGRVYDPQRPYLYDTPDNHWRWQSDADQATYRDLKNRSREAYRRAKFMIGIAVANRIISVLDAIRDTRRANRSLERSFSHDKPLEIQFSTFDDGAKVQLALRTPF